VQRPSELAAHTANERRKAEGVNKAFTEEELNLYLDALPPNDTRFQPPPPPR
jgi:hypothetical protein